MTGFVLHLSFSASLEIEMFSGFRSMVTEGIEDLGIVPPPILDSPFPAHAFSGNPSSFFIINSALNLIVHLSLRACLVLGR